MKNWKFETIIRQIDRCTEAMKTANGEKLHKILDRNVRLWRELERRNKETINLAVKVE